MYHIWLTLYLQLNQAMEVAMKKMLGVIVFFISGCTGYTSLHFQGAGINIIPPSIYPVVVVPQPVYQEDRVYYINNGPPPGGCRPWHGKIICDSEGYRGAHPRHRCNECHGVNNSVDSAI